MKILVKDEIRHAISSCQPSKVAVAYIGSDWSRFLPEVEHLQTVIVSPTIGTNPWALAELAKRIGWRRIFFLNELHAKIYLGARSAVVGSANLTSNGLSGEGLIELCVEINASKGIAKLNKVFDELKSQARKQYPTAKSKKARLKELETSWGRGIANRIIEGQHLRARAFLEFEPLGRDHFYVLWFQPGDYEYTDDLKAIQPWIADEMHFTSADKVEKNKWMLVWRMTNSHEPHRTVKPYWIYIHEVFDNGIIDGGYGYPKCAIQRTDLDVPSPPFEITSDVAAAFRKTVQRKEIARYLIQSDREVFSLAYSMKGMLPLIAGMKRYMANKPNAAGAKRQRG